MTEGPRSGLRPPAPRWILRPPPDSTAVSDLAGELGLPPSLCAVLVQRGFASAGAARDHLRPLIEHFPDPTRIVDLDRAVARIRGAIEVGEPIFVHGDYDVDGVCAAALLTLWLRRLGADVQSFVPHRLRDGYDLSIEGVDRARRAGAGLLVTVDCGISAHDAVAHARRIGLDVIVTDHHTPPESLPPAHAVVNPNRVDDDSGYGMLCGAGVAFAVVSRLAAMAGHPPETLLPDLDLVALATVADLVPLEGPNRAMVRYGLRALGRTRRPGLAALLEVCELGESGVPVDDRPPIPAGRVGFVLAPRINAVGRMGDAGDALRLLLTEDEGEARELALRLDEINRARREEDRRTLDEALALLEGSWDPDRDYGVVLAGEGWHPGVIGIVASRIVERIHRPVVLVAMDGERGRGSARSIPGFHLHDAITGLSEALLRFGGHAQAAGLEVERSRVPDLKTGFARIARERLESEDLRPRIRIDLELDPGEATLELAERSRWLGPHGIGNPRPVYLSRNLGVRDAREVGSGHLKLRVDGGGATLDAIGFGLVDRIDPAGLAGTKIDAVFQLSVNEWRGRRSAQMKLLDLRPAGGDVEEAE